MVALTAAGLGTFASAGANAGVTSTTSPGHASSAATGAQAHAVDDRVDVSRSFDRTELKRQTALQVEQQAQALKEIDGQVVATAKVRDREEKVRVQREQKRRKQWVLPVTGYRLSARFGQQSSLWSSGAHTGLDFAGPAGTKIVSVTAGTVTSAAYEGSYGNRTVITLRDGTKISYSHQSRFVVKAGEQVQPGQPIGYTGSTGNVTGPHLHLEVERPGSGHVDPVPVLREHGINP